MRQNITLREYIEHYYLPCLAASNYSPSIKEHYRALLRRSDPALLNLPMRKITPQMAKEHVTWMKREKNYSTATITLSIRALSSCYRHAIANGLDCSDPFHEIHVHNDTAKCNYYSYDDLLALERTIPYYYEPDLFLAGLYTTIDLSELLVMTFDHIPLHLNEKAADCFLRAKELQKYKKRQNGSSFNSHNLLFPNPHGIPYRHNRLYLYIDMIREASGVYHYSPGKITRFNRQYGGLALE